MNKWLLFIVSFFLLHSTVFSQDKEIVEIADEMYNFGDTKDALDVYLQALQINPNNVKANYMAGRCFLETNHKDKSVSYLEKAFKLNPDISQDILYLIAKGYHYGYEFEDAMANYEQYKSRISGYIGDKKIDKEKGQHEIDKANRKIEECKNGIEFVKTPLEVKMINMGEGINTAYPDYAPVITPDEKLMIFTSRRRGSTGNKKDNDNEFFEDIYIATSEDKKNWKVENIGSPINTEFHEGSIGLSHDGKTLFVYNEHKGGDIYFSKAGADGKWTLPESIGKEINTKYYEPSACISDDGKTLFFSSNNPIGLGGLDIYFSELQENGSWGTPQNLGGIINTKYDEDSPFLDVTGTVLYFSSSGHNSMGDYDIFRSEKVDNKWSEPVNLGYPINSTDDDINFVVSGDGKHGYYSSVKDDSYGEKDIYKIDLDPKKASLEDTNALASSLPDSIIMDSSTALVLEEPLVEEPVLEEKSIKEEPIKEEPKPTPVVIKENKFENKNLQAGSIVILRNVYFDFNKATLRSDSYEELNALADYLLSNSSTIEIGGHTDNVGGTDYNKSLSQKRATAVVNYLANKGISRSRLMAVGYGEELPLASNDDEEEGRELNRRTEFKVVSSN